MSLKPPFFYVFINNVARGAVQFDFLLQKSRKLVTRDVSIFTTDLLFRTQRVASDEMNARAFIASPDRR